MASQRAEAVLAVTPAGPGQVIARLRLACGCEVTPQVAAARIQEIVGGGRLAVGKYRCPAGCDLVRTHH